MDSLLSLINKVVSVEPRYDEEVCLAANRTGSCRECADACPHDAILVTSKVELDSVDCSGCGLCVHACPSQALETNPRYERGRSVRCSRVKGSAQSVLCLGRLQASDLLRLLGGKERITLAHADCASCPIGSSAVLAALEEAREEALELAGLHGREARIELLQTERFDLQDRGDVVSRRELLRGGWQGLKERAGDMLAPLDPGEDEPDLPGEMQRRYRVIAASHPAPEEPVPWRLPVVGDACIMCPMCTNACPTGAIERTFEATSDGVLMLDPERCMGCDACMSACPVRAIEMEEPVSWERLSAGRHETYRREPGKARSGGIAR